MKKPWVLAIACAICGCAPEQSRAQSAQAEVDALSSAYIGCMARAVSVYDDHRSDPAAIGVKVNDACRAEFDRWLQNRAKELTPDEKRQFLEGMRPRGPKIDTDVVLRTRATAQQ
ncbi:MAG: hypothetical protein AB7F22_31625 [Reyranella sp.]|uniref:hypothetical protein n=1 Tax=Reyranella sp. TaxID=1929291 RepID=UPI003D12D54A